MEKKVEKLGDYRKGEIKKKCEKEYIYAWSS